MANELALLNARATALRTKLAGTRLGGHQYVGMPGMQGEQAPGDHLTPGMGQAAEGAGQAAQGPGMPQGLESFNDPGNMDLDRGNVDDRNAGYERPVPMDAAGLRHQKALDALRTPARMPEAYWNATGAMSRHPYAAPAGGAALGAGLGAWLGGEEHRGLGAAVGGGLGLGGGMLAQHLAQNPHILANLMKGGTDSVSLGTRAGMLAAKGGRF